MIGANYYRILIFIIFIQSGAINITILNIFEFLRFRERFV